MHCQCKVNTLYSTTVQNDGATTVPVFAHICTPPVWDGGGYTDSVSATGDCNGTTNVPSSSSAK